MIVTIAIVFTLNRCNGTIGTAARRSTTRNSKNETADSASKPSTNELVQPA